VAFSTTRAQLERNWNLDVIVNMSGRAKLEVVIPTRDRPAQLAQTLDALRAQSDNAFGVIVVDDGGETRAENLVSDAMRRSLSIRFIRNETSIGPGASRNRGVEASAAKHIVFIDDDCTADHQLVARHRGALATGGSVVSLGPILCPPGRRLPVWTHWDADRLEREYARLARGDANPGWRHLYTGNVGMRREDFVAVGGFDTRFARQEDVELGYRLARFGCRFTFDPAAVVWHDSDRTLHGWLRIPEASARFDVLMDRLVPDSDRLSGIRDELTAKHWGLRVTRPLTRTPLVQRWAVNSAISVGCLLHALRADRAALAAFSLVWDLIYSRAFLKASVGEPQRSSP
jgi:GT2 family glycosyltransferase